MKGTQWDPDARVSRDAGTVEQGLMLVLFLLMLASGLTGHIAAVVALAVVLLVLAFDNFRRRR